MWGWMIDRDKVIKGLNSCAKWMKENDGDACNSCPYHNHFSYDDNDCIAMVNSEAIVLLKEHEVRELTMDEWREWKNNSKRNPICELWENDTSPMWVLNPDTIHEPALLMGKLKLFTGKPTLEQCKEVKWDE